MNTSDCTRRPHRPPYSPLIAVGYALRSRDARLLSLRGRRVLRGLQSAGAANPVTGNDRAMKWVDRINKVVSAEMCPWGKGGMASPPQSPIRTPLSPCLARLERHAMGLIRGYRRVSHGATRALKRPDAPPMRHASGERHGDVRLVPAGPVGADALPPGRRLLRPGRLPTGKSGTNVKI
jgi:hypothetical protein